GPTNGRDRHRAAPERDHPRGGIVEEPEGDDALSLPKARLALVDEELADGHPRLLGQEIVGVDEGHRERACDQPPDRALARSHEPAQDEGPHLRCSSNLGAPPSRAGDTSPSIFAPRAPWSMLIVVRSTPE